MLNFFLILSQPGRTTILVVQKAYSPPHPPYMVGQPSWLSKKITTNTHTVAQASLLAKSPHLHPTL
ncbi:MAG: hypothetical protein ACK4SO_04430 [Candidatus Kapaibacteriota bacterium]